MIRFSSFTPRMWLILAHDLLATAAAVVASFFIRFEAEGLAERWGLLVFIAPRVVVGGGELLHPVRGGGTRRALAASGDRAARLRGLLRLCLRLLGPLQGEV